MSEISAHSSPLPWHPLLRVLFRVVALWVLFAFFSALTQLVPMLGMVGYEHDQAVRPFYVWVGKVVLGVDITVFPNGSGDTTYNWVQAASHLVFALIGALLWSAIDWRRPSYPWLKDGLWIGMRSSSRARSSVTASTRSSRCNFQSQDCSDSRRITATPVRWD